ncbi:MAG: aminotransferase class IV [Candidatus Omnitrophota bacterium]
MNKNPYHPGQTKEFSLLETILWENGEFFLFEDHLSRLEKSARFFSFPLDLSSVAFSMIDHAKKFISENKYRLRLLVNNEGECNVSSSLLPPPTDISARVIFSGKATDKNDIFLSHKTTNRELYDKEFSSCRKNGYFDALFMNTEGEITEGAISNIIIKRGDVYMTPPLSSGILPGTYRGSLLRSQKIPLKEQTLRKADILSAEKIFIINSVIKMLPVELQT